MGVGHAQLCQRVAASGSTWPRVAPGVHDDSMTPSATLRTDYQLTLSAANPTWLRLRMVGAMGDAAAGLASSAAIIRRVCTQLATLTRSSKWSSRSFLPSTGRMKRLPSVV